MIFFSEGKTYVKNVISKILKISKKMKISRKNKILNFTKINLSQPPEGVGSSSLDMLEAFICILVFSTKKKSVFFFNEFLLKKKSGNIFKKNENIKNFEKFKIFDIFEFFMF